MSETKHTPVPWKVGINVSHGGKILIREGGQQTHLQIVPEADAVLIVEAVNNHARLVAENAALTVALKRLLMTMEKHSPYCAAIMNPEDCNCNCAQGAARAAIGKDRK